MHIGQSKEDKQVTKILTILIKKPYQRDKTLLNREKGYKKEAAKD